QRMLRSIFSVGRVHPSFAKEGYTPASSVPMKTTPVGLSKPAHPRPVYVPEYAKRNLDSSAFAKEGYTPASRITRQPKPGGQPKPTHSRPIDIPALARFGIGNKGLGCPPQRTVKMLTPFEGVV